MNPALLLLSILLLLLCGVAATAGAAETYVFDGAWGSPGAAPGQLNGPMDLAVDGAGHVYVADYGNDRVQRFNGTGGSPAVLGAGAVSRPQGVAATPERVYVSDSNNHRVVVYAPNGTLLGQWGGYGTATELGKFLYPRGMAVNATGCIYVADVQHNRVQSFRPNGDQFIAGGWGSTGTGPRQFQAPTRLAIDAAGCVYVVDSGNNRVQKFSADGAFLAAWGSRGTGDGQFENPGGVAVDADGTVYVSDWGNNRIERFRPVLAVPSGAGIPTDTDADRLYDDVNGNGRKDFADVVLYFNHMTWIAANEPVSAFDCNTNGRVDFADVVWLFNHL